MDVFISLSSNAQIFFRSYFGPISKFSLSPNSFYWPRLVNFLFSYFPLLLHNILLVIHYLASPTSRLLVRPKFGPKFGFWLIARHWLIQFVWCRTFWFYWLLHWLLLLLFATYHKIGPFRRQKFGPKYGFQLIWTLTQIPFVWIHINPKFNIGGSTSNCTCLDFKIGISMLNPTMVCNQHWRQIAINL